MDCVLTRVLTTLKDCPRLIIKGDFFQDNANIVYTDASLNFIGGMVCNGDECFTWKHPVRPEFTKDIQGKNKILILEAIALLMTLRLMSHKHQRNLFFVDNMGVLLSTIKGYSRNKQLNQIIGEFLKETANESII